MNCKIFLLITLLLSPISIYAQGSYEVRLPYDDPGKYSGYALIEAAAFAPMNATSMQLKVSLSFSNSCPVGASVVGEADSIKLGAVDSQTPSSMQTHRMVTKSGSYPSPVTYLGDFGRVDTYCIEDVSRQDFNDVAYEQSININSTTGRGVVFNLDEANFTVLTGLTFGQESYRGCDSCSRIYYRSYGVAT